MPSYSFSCHIISEVEKLLESWISTCYDYLSIALKEFEERVSCGISETNGNWFKGVIYLFLSNVIPLKNFSFSNDFWQKFKVHSFS